MISSASEHRRGLPHGRRPRRRRQRSPAGRASRLLSRSALATPMAIDHRRARGDQQMPEQRRGFIWLAGRLRPGVADGVGERGVQAEPVGCGGPEREARATPARPATLAGHTDQLDRRVISRAPSSSTITTGFASASCSKSTSTRGGARCARRRSPALEPLRFAATERSLRAPCEPPGLRPFHRRSEHRDPGRSSRSRPNGPVALSDFRRLTVQDDVAPVLGEQRRLRPATATCRCPARRPPRRGRAIRIEGVRRQPQCFQLGSRAPTSVSPEGRGRLGRA